MPFASCMKVLIVDDHPDSVAVAEARLAGENVTICSASSGAAALEAARREKPDLILLDVDMPDMSGFDVCRALKADVELCMIPVLFLSGSGNLEDKVQGLDLGAVDYVTKPFDSFELRARVRAALRNKHLQDMLIEHAQVDPLTGLCNRRALWSGCTKPGRGSSGTAATCRSSSPTWTTSSGSTTPTGTTWATRFYRRLPSRSSASAARWICRRVTAATSS